MITQEVLGKEVWRIADDVARFGYQVLPKGRVGSTQQCPVANALRDALPDAHLISVNSLVITVDDFQVGVPDNLESFIKRFDCHELPEMVAV